jgi:NhaA family Na+:H+ antiporter
VTSRAPAPPSLRPATFINRGSALARLARPVAQFMRIEAGGGILLVVATVVALVWANSPWSAAYHSLWETPIRIDVGSWRFAEDLQHVVNDALMAVFFFVVGLEIKRELVVGELRDRRQVALPAFAAVGGMVVPALIFVAFNAGGPGSRGWGIPMATDIAFAVGVMAVLGRRVPAPLKVFLLTLAIADDLGAIAVIAIFYSDGLQLQYLLVAAGIAAVVAAMRRVHVAYPPVFVVAGIALWVVIFESGIHATIAGVVMGLLTPARPLQDELTAESVVDALENRAELTTEDVRATAAAIRESVSVCDRLIELLHPWTSYLIVPVFALANAGIALDANPLDESSIFLGVLLGLVVGKTVGITAFGWLATRARLASLPPGVTWGHFAAAGMLAGIGFTVSLFITSLALPDEALAEPAKVGILLASVVAAVAGSALFVALARGRGAPDDDVA